MSDQKITPMQRAALAGLELLAAQGKLTPAARIGHANLVQRLDALRLIAAGRI